MKSVIFGTMGRMAMLASLALATTVWAQSGSPSAASQTDPQSTPQAAGQAQTTPSTASSAPAAAPGTTPVATTDVPAPKDSSNGKPQDKPAPGTAPVTGDVAAPNVNPDKVIEPGSEKINVKPGSIDDVSAVGNRDIGGRGMGNWYSVDGEIKMGRDLIAICGEGRHPVTHCLVRMTQAERQQSAIDQ